MADSREPVAPGEPSGSAGTTRESAGAIAELYLGNILYAIERCAMSLEAEDKPMDAAFYRGIGRKLADAHGRTRPDR
ncbi:MAG: hypothetical protein V4617_13985 [Gemmatimonadota bacterium]